MNVMQAVVTLVISMFIGFLAFTWSQYFLEQALVGFGLKWFTIWLVTTVAIAITFHVSSILWKTKPVATDDSNHQNAELSKEI